jgi:adenosylmethionine-8-amino-7-oxononanoate aminotransferase
VANASIELLLNSPWQDNIARIEKHFYRVLSPLKENDKVADVRILGAIGVVEMVDDIDDFNLYLQSIDRKSLHQMLATLNQHTKILTLKNKVRWYLDIDPIE